MFSKAKDYVMELIGYKPPETADPIQNIVGAFGVYQLGLFLIICLSKFFIAFHQMAIIFLAPKVIFKCNDTNAQTCPCDAPEYDKSIFTNTIIMEWNLICERRWMYSITQTLFQLGTLLGSVVFGMASDRFGRRPPFLFAVVLQLGMAVSAAFAPDFWTFTFLRFLVGVSVGGTMVVGFVIIMEFIGIKYRYIMGALYQSPFNFGHMLLPVFAYFLRDYSKFQLGISLPGIILFSYFFFVPETPRWLIAMRHPEKAIKILKHVAKINKRPTENIESEIEAYQRYLEHHQLKKGHIIDLFRTPNLRKNILAMSYNWLSCSYCFYGVSQYMGQLAGDAFINVGVSGTVCLIGTILTVPLLRFFGRKTIVITFNISGGLCLLLLPWVPAGVATVSCACIGVVSSFVVFSVVYLYCSEMFPTVVRNAAVGFSSMSARIGSMIAPFVVDLKSNADWLPPVAFAVVPLIAAFVTLLLPETRGHELMTTIEEGESFGKKIKKTRTSDT